MRATTSQRGHTLIEMMVSMAIFSIGVLGLIPMFVASSQGISTSTKFGYATALAQAKLEELQRLPWDADELTAGAHDDGLSNIGPAGLPYKPDGTATSDIGAADGWFARRWTITEDDINPGAAGNDWKQIEVEITWTDLVGSRRVVISGGKARLE